MHSTKFNFHHFTKDGASAGGRGKGKHLEGGAVVCHNSLRREWEEGKVAKTNKQKQIEK
jgi:hypothetical protein